MSEVRQATDELLCAVALGDWPKVKRLSRKLSSMSIERRKFELARWLRTHGAEHPAVANWIREQARERDAERKADAEPAYTQRRDWCGYAFQQWKAERDLYWWKHL